MKHLLNTTICVALLAFVFNACSEDDEKESVQDRASFVTTETVSGAAFDEVTVTIDGYKPTLDKDGKPYHQLFINGMEVDSKSIGFNSKYDVTITVPAGVGSGRIELQVGTEKIQGPMFQYQQTYVGFLGLGLGQTLTRYTDNSLIAQETFVTNTFRIIEFQGVSMDGNYPVASITSKKVDVTIPDKDVSASRVYASVGMAVSPEKEVFFYQEYQRQRDVFSHYLLSTDLENTVYVEGYGTEDFGPIIDVEIDDSGSIFTCEFGKPFIRKNNGNIGVFAGANTPGHRDGDGAEAQFTKINAMTMDKANNLYIADGSCIRKVTSTGVVTTLAGNTEGGDKDGAAMDARFEEVMGLFMATDGTLYIADTGNEKIKTLGTDGSVHTLRGAASYHEEEVNTFHIYVDSHKNIFTMDGGKYAQLVMYVSEDNLTGPILKTASTVNGLFECDVQEQ